MADDDATFSAKDAVFAQRAMRNELGLGPQAFPLQAFVGMISDEIEQLRAAGKTDEDISVMIQAATGKPILIDKTARYCAMPEALRR